MAITNWSEKKIKILNNFYFKTKLTTYILQQVTKCVSYLSNLHQLLFIAHSTLLVVEESFCRRIVHIERKNVLLIIYFYF